MSLVREQFDATLEIKVGSLKIMSLTIEDPETGEPLDLSDEDIYNTGIFVIREPDRTIIATTDFDYVDRPNGLIEFTITPTIASSENAGNWEGVVKFVNSTSSIIDQRIFNFNILS